MSGPVYINPHKRTQNRKYKGEWHAPIWKPTLSNPLRFQSASYMGPGTNLYRRLLRGIAPKSKADRRAIVHDSAYALAKNSEDVRKADHKAISGALWDTITFQDNIFNTGQMVGGLGLKTVIEDTGVIKAGDVGGYGDATNPKWRKVLEEVVSTGASDETLKKIKGNRELRVAAKQQRRQAARLNKTKPKTGLVSKIKDKAVTAVKAKAAEMIQPRTAPKEQQESGNENNEEQASAEDKEIKPPPVHDEL